MGLVLSGFFLAGLFAAGSGRLGRPAAEVPAEPTPPASAAEIRVVALGDSITRGAGDSRGGYPARLREALVKARHSVALENLAVDGATSEDLLARLRTPLARDAVAHASLVLVSISGNDLTHALSRLEGDGATALAPVLGGSIANVTAILEQIRAANASAPIRLLGIYDPTGGDERVEARRGLSRWNSSLEQAALGVKGALLVPIADLFSDRPDRLAADRFHPGPTGHDTIAARVLATLPSSFTERRP
jgi:lysophospholipase L1-like esterase